MNLNRFVNYFESKNNNNKSSDIKKKNNNNTNFDPVLDCSKSGCLLSLKDTNMPVGMDSIINLTMDIDSNIENSDNNAL